MFDKRGTCYLITLLILKNLKKKIITKMHQKFSKKSLDIKSEKKNKAVCCKISLLFSFLYYAKKLYKAISLLACNVCSGNPLFITFWSIANK